EASDQGFHALAVNRVAQIVQIRNDPVGAETDHGFDVIPDRLRCFCYFPSRQIEFSGSPIGKALESSNVKIQYGFAGHSPDLWQRHEYLSLDFDGYGLRTDRGVVGLGLVDTLDRDGRRTVFRIAKFLGGRLEHVVQRFATETQDVERIDISVPDA